LTFAWSADYPDPSDFLNYLIASGGPQALPPFDDPDFQRRAKAAAALSGPRRYLAYGSLDIETARDDAPWLAVGYAISQDFFSKRVGCQVYQPVYGMDLASLCIRH
jgi:ABC-type oligopeptide transport system substrate-binding subunit